MAHLTVDHPKPTTLPPPASRPGCATRNAKRIPRPVSSRERGGVRGRSEGGLPSALGGQVEGECLVPALVLGDRPMGIWAGTLAAERRIPADERAAKPFPLAAGRVERPPTADERSVSAVVGPTFAGPNSEACAILKDRDTS